VNNGAQLGAQPGAQPPADPTERAHVSMPIDAADIELLNEVLARHPEVDQELLARRAGINKGTMSRIAGGQWSVSAPVLRALYELTADPAIVDYLLGPKRVSLVAETLPIAGRTDDPFAAFLTFVDAQGVVAKAAQRVLFPGGHTLTGAEQQGAHLREAVGVLVNATRCLVRTAARAVGERYEKSGGGAPRHYETNPNPGRVA